MKFSAQEEYGLRCLMTIASRDLGSGLTIPEIAKIESMTQPHVAKMLAILRKAEFIRSTRGQYGGYMLARRPGEIIIGDVLAELGGRMFEFGFCERHSGTSDECVHLHDCSVRGLWTRIQSAVDAVVNRITLQDLLDGKMVDEPITLQPIARRASVACVP